jgi:hypothetical protein
MSFQQLRTTSIKILPFAAIPQLAFRLRVLGFIKQECWTPLLFKLRCLGSIGKAITDSVKLKEFFKFVLVLGNYINNSQEIDTTEVVFRLLEQSWSMEINCRGKKKRQLSGKVAQNP